MKLYHGSVSRIEKPDVSHSRANLDFGRGFYLTSFKSQAEKWALRKATFEKKPAILNVFNFRADVGGIKKLEFSENDAEWVEFVCECRRGHEVAGYDLIVGGVADDKVYEAVNMYFKGYWDMQTTLSALNYYERNDQYCFITQRAIDTLLVFEDAYEVKQ